MSGSPAFRRLVADCGLSALFAENVVRQACEDAGVDPEGLHSGNLEAVLSNLEGSLRLFLPDRYAVVMKSLREGG